MDILEHNRAAWDRYVDRENPWTKPVSAEQIRRAREGDWSIVLTPRRQVPRSWFPQLEDCRVLCLASGGGQQGPILAAAGARVTVFDNSGAQLAQDRSVSERDSLGLELIQGDMRDLGVFSDGAFDLVVHPVSNLFVPDVRLVWKEARRVLRSGGAMLSGFVNPIVYLFDYEKSLEGVLEVRHKLPYSDLTDLAPEVRERLLGQGEAVEFGHTLDDQIGGQIDAGFLVDGFYEDRDPEQALGKFIDTYIATRSIAA